MNKVLVKWERPAVGFQAVPVESVSIRDPELWPELVTGAAVEATAPDGTIPVGALGTVIVTHGALTDPWAVASRAVTLIVEDLCDRRGLRQEWEAIDPKTQDEIRETWLDLIAHSMAVMV